MYSSIISGLFIIILLFLGCFCMYQIGKIDGRMETYHKFYDIQDVMEEYYKDYIEKERDNGDAIGLAEVYGKIEGSIELVLLYFKTEERRNKNGTDKKRSDVQLLLSEM